MTAMIDGGMIGATTAVEIGERGGEIEVVALAHHLRDQERAERGDVGHGRARDAAEEHAVDDVDVGEPAAEAADQRGGEVDDHARHPAARGDVAGQNEQGRRQQQIGVREQADEAGRDDDRVEGRIEHRRAERADAHGDADRHAQQDEDEEDDQERFGHRLLKATRMVRSMGRMMSAEPIGMAA